LQLHDIRELSNPTPVSNISCIILVVGIQVIDYGSRDVECEGSKHRPDSRAPKSRWGCGRMNPILMGSTLPIVKVMGGWVKRLDEVEMKIRRRIVGDEECER
jgi:hypothetical protein